MSLTHYYNASTKTYIAAFSKLFSGVHVKRYTSAGVEVKDIKVPLVYASKRKISYLLNQNTTSEPASIVLPVIGFNIVAIDFDSERRLNPLNEHSVSSTESIYEGMPWNYNIEVTVRTKYQEDYWQIIEQLLYLFKPEVTLDIKELSAYPTWIRDTMVTLESISVENDTELSQDEDDVRDFRATMSFLLKGIIYPASTADSLIEHIDVNFINDIDETIAQVAWDWVSPDEVLTITE